MGYSNSLRKRREFAPANPTVTPATTYAGVLSSPFVAPAMKLASTLVNGYVRQIDGIQNKAVISSLTSGDPLQAAAQSCEWVDGDDLTLGERVLDLADLAVMQSLCRATLLPTWAGMGGARATMTAGSPEFVNFAMATVAAATAESVENNIWLGGTVVGKGFLSDTGALTSAGYNASILGGASVNEIAVLATGFTSAVLTQGTSAFDKAYGEAITKCPAVLNKPDVAFYVGTALAGQYMTALGVAGGSGYQTNVTNQSFTNLQYLGIPIRVCPGMPAQAIVLTHQDNLVVGSNLNTDYTSAQYIDHWQFSGSDETRIVIRFGLGMQVAVPGDVVVGALSTIL
tara:strand:+ start:169 stop:1194 length:1026 start_codon:yes stop_codon:yes gene_type:complete